MIEQGTIVRGTNRSELLSGGGQVKDPQERHGSYSCGSSVPSRHQRASNLCLCGERISFNQRHPF